LRVPRPGGLGPARMLSKGKWPPARKGKLADWPSQTFPYRPAHAIVSSQ